jgi:tRNA nucleotidyltransferase (CCA-adding enzyme)
VRDIKEDLARRDFTINALAYNPKSGLIDYFDGACDIESKMIRCVGDPCARFEEDALRIMRALRFSSTLGFEIEKGTSEAINAKRGLLKNIANERITEELDKLFCGDGVAHVLTEYREVFETIFPEINPLYGLDQNNPHHDLDVWGHTVKSVACAPKNAVIRMTMFLHDIGKSGCYSEVEGVGHFYGHQKVSADLAKLILKRLKYDNNTISTVTQLITFHDADIQDSSINIKRWLNRLGEHNLRLLVEVKRADTKAHAPGHQDKRLRHLDEVIRQLDIIIAEQHCFSIKDLEINGNDLIEAGIPQGRKIGEMLGLLLDMVIDEQVENNREALLNEVKEK